MSFDTTKQSPSSVRPTSKTGTIWGWSSLARILASIKKRFDILGARDSFRVGHLDGDRAVEVIVVSEIDPSEPALAEPADDPVAADFGGIDVGEVARTLERRMRAGRFPAGSSSHPRGHSNRAAGD